MLLKSQKKYIFCKNHFLTYKSASDKRKSKDYSGMAEQENNSPLKSKFIMFSNKQGDFWIKVKNIMEKLFKDNTRKLRIFI